MLTQTFKEVNNYGKGVQVTFNHQSHKTTKPKGKRSV